MRDVGIVTGNVVNIECQTHEDAEKAIAVAREVLLNIPQRNLFFVVNGLVDCINYK